jgi:hypothetical protein
VLRTAGGNGAEIQLARIEVAEKNFPNALVLVFFRHEDYLDKGRKAND